MRIAGLIKTTLLDYPNTLAATIFTHGCNMKCPFCHNKELVTGSPTLIDYDEILAFLSSRKDVLEGICITGGEPTLQQDLYSFISIIKSYGYNVKLDTNGLNPYLLNELIKDSLIDYVAMDIKNSLNKYALTCGASIDIKLIEKSASILLNSNIEYEFRTTVVKDFHSEKDFIEIGKWLEGGKKYFLQQYKYGDNQLIDKEYSSYSKEELLFLSELIKKFFIYTSIRGC